MSPASGTLSTRPSKSWNLSTVIQEPSSPLPVSTSSRNTDPLCAIVGRSMPRTHQSEDEIQGSIAKHVADGDTAALEQAQIEEMMVLGCLACPKEKTLRQRDKYFGQVKFLDLQHMLRLAETQDIV